MEKYIKNYDNYLIFDTGEVFNTITKKFLSGSIGKNGYKYYRLSKNNKKQMFYAHRLVAEYFIENPCNLPVVNHKDGNKLNNYKDNLEWISYSDNTKHFHQIIKKNKMNRECIKYIEDLKDEEWR